MNDEGLLKVFHMAIGDRAIETGATALPMDEMLRVGLRAVAAEAWDEGWDMLPGIDNPDHNPYRSKP